MLVDTIFSSEGLPDLPPEFMAKAVAIVRRAGGIYIADEVQPGFGRTGESMWGYQRYGVVPDVVTLGKPMANGHPVSGVVARAELANEFAAKVMYFNTFGGNPVSCAAAEAVLDVLEKERLQENARAVGEYALEGLKRLMAKHDLIGDVRGRGLFFGAELVTDRRKQTPAAQEAKRVVNAMREHGVLISRIGVHDNVLKIRPPMPFSKENADLLLATLDDALRGA
jgi:4-aminobutyrate aminotransferase-like enzyme